MTRGSTASGRVFWLTIGSFGVYYLLTGYLPLHRFGASAATGRAGDLAIRIGGYRRL